MKRLIILGCLLVTGPLWATADDFLKTLTPEELAVTGLQKLTPAELARLAAVVERYKTGEVAVMQQRVEEAQQAAEAKAKQAGTKAAEAPLTSPVADKRPSWLKALITLDKVAKQPDRNDAFESRIAGEFRGWRRGTVFNLENGQRWQHQSGEDYVTPPVQAPKVKIYPGALGTYWMEIEGAGPRVRVKPIRLE